MSKQLWQRRSGRSSITKHFKSGSIVFLSLCHIVTWNRGGGNGLGIPTSVRSYGSEKATQWLETRLTKIEEQLKESVNSYLK